MRVEIVLSARRVIKISAAVLGCIIAFMVILETVLLICDKITVCPFLFDKRYNLYRSKPGSLDYSFKINSQGFKDIEFSEKKASGIYRIVAVGDSNAFGTVPYKYNFLTILGELLKKKDGKCELYNLGTPCIGPHDYLSLIVHEGIKYDPDLVLVCLTIEDDLSSRKWYTRIMTASLFKSLYDAFKGYEGVVVHGPRIYNDSEPAFTGPGFLAYTTSKIDVFNKNNPRIKKKFDDTLYYLERIGEVCAKKNIELVVVFLTAEIQINEELQKSVLRGFGTGKGDYDFLYPDRIFGEGLGKRGIKHIDIYPDFSRAAAGGARLFIPRNVHYNIAGNRLAGEVISRELSGIIKKHNHR